MRFVILKKPVAQKSILYICVSFSVSVGEGEDDVFRENSMYIIYSETDHQPRWDAWDKCSGLVHWEDPEQSGGEGGGRGDRDGEYM